MNIIKKNLVLENNLYLESFYRFRLKSLHDKWEELVSLSNENKEYLGMGTTVLAIVILNGFAAVAHVGDSRAYFINDEIKQIIERARENKFIASAEEIRKRNC